MNKKQVEALLNCTLTIGGAVSEANPGREIPVVQAIDALREAFAEPEAPESMEPVPCVECGMLPEIRDHYLRFFADCSGHATTPDCNTPEGAIRVWNVTQEATRRER